MGILLEGFYIGIFSFLQLPRLMESIHTYLHQICSGSTWLCRTDHPQLHPKKGLAMLVDLSLQGTLDHYT